MGLAKKNYDGCPSLTGSDAGGVAFVTLLIFCSEGDNIAGVLLVANQLDRWMKLVATHNNAPAWKFPASWKHFFGNPPPVAMY